MSELKKYLQLLIAVACSTDTETRTVYVAALRPDQNFITRGNAKSRPISYATHRPVPSIPINKNKRQAINFLPTHLF